MIVRRYSRFVEGCCHRHLVRLLSDRSSHTWNIWIYHRISWGSSRSGRKNTVHVDWLRWRCVRIVWRRSPVGELKQIECFLTLRLCHTGIEIMKSIEELDLSDNFITSIPAQIREMPMIKRVRIRVQTESAWIPSCSLSSTSLVIHLRMRRISDKKWSLICPLCLPKSIERFVTDFFLNDHWSSLRSSWWLIIDHWQTKKNK